MTSTNYVKKKPLKKSTQKAINVEQNKIILILALIIIILFVTILYFIVSNKPNAKKTVEKPPVLTREHVLPPKPEDRWSYIKELEDRTTFIDPAEAQSSTINATRPLTPEQRKILENLQQDQTQIAARQNTAPARVEMQPIQTPPTTISNQAKKTPIKQPIPQPKPVPAPKPTASQPAQNSSVTKWNIQCGSFKTKTGADSVKAQLAFAGFSSKIASANGWHRVILGPYATKKAASDALSSLKKSAINSCVVLSGG